MFTIIYFAFFAGVIVASGVAYLYVRGLNNRHEDDVRCAWYQGRVARELELEEMLENSGS